jgi:hypothetical protein
VALLKLRLSTAHIFEQRLATSTITGCCPDLHPSQGQNNHASYAFSKAWQSTLLHLLADAADNYLMPMTTAASI